MAKKHTAKELAAKATEAKKRGQEAAPAAGPSPPKKAKKAAAAAAAPPAAAAAAGSPTKKAAAAAAKAAPAGGGAAEIDDLFGQLKGKKKAAAEAAAEAEAPASPSKGGKGKAAAKVRMAACAELSIYCPPSVPACSGQLSCHAASLQQCVQCRSCTHPSAPQPFFLWPLLAQKDKVVGSKDDIFGTEAAAGRK